MPNWLTLDFLMLNWQPLVVALVLGYILGWLVTGMPNARRARTAEERTAEVEARMRRSERELTEVRVQGETSKTRFASLQSDLDAANVRIATFEEAAKDFAAASLRQAEAIAQGTIGIDDGAADGTGQEFPSAEGALPADEPLVDEIDVEMEEDAWSEEGSDSDIATPYVVAAAARAAAVHHGEHEETGDETSTDIGSRFRTVAQRVDPIAVPDNRDIALAEAYAHAATLQNELEKNDNALRMQQADLEALRAQVQVANAARHELETRLVRAREDVASELAVLASTMIKMKDDALGRADAKIAALANELDGVRSAASRSLETHHRAAEDEEIQAPAGGNRIAGNWTLDSQAEEDPASGE